MNNIFVDNIEVELSVFVDTFLGAKANNSSLVHLFTNGEGNLKPITSAHICITLRAAATLIGEDRLVFKIKDIGTHSIRSGASMAMYLDDVPVYTIMIVGR